MSQPEEIGDQLFPRFGQHAFRMKLHALDWVASMAQAHDGAGAVFFGCPCADFEFRRQVFFLDDERVVARGGRGYGKALERRFGCRA
jgi:hypothetical protein